MFGTATRHIARSSTSLLRPAAASSSRIATATALPRLPLVAAAATSVRCSPFSTTPLARGSGESDVELSSKLAQEIAFEKENNASILPAPDAEPEFVTAFKKAGIWKIEEKPGMDEIFLTRQFGNENIRILVSIGDIDTTSVQPEDMDGESFDDKPAGADGAEDEVTAFPVRMAITISKPNKGAMTFEAVAQDGEMSIDNITFLRDNKMAEDLTPEADWARRGIYVGPQFDTLDEAVQEQFEAFLVERGIDQDLALFIPNFAEYKEQKEYCQWLENVRDFVDA